MKAFRKKASSMWGATLVICVTIVVSSAMTATAAKLITGKQIKNSTITSSDIKNGTIKSADLAPGTAISGPAGTAGPAGPAGVAGAAGTARAYAAIDDSGPVLVPSHSKNVASVRRESLGVYCVKLSPSVDATTAAPVASFDWANSGPLAAFVSVYASNPGNCGVGTNELRVRTYLDDATTLADTISFIIVVP